MKTAIKIPGKVILAGEHAVVYGKEALSASIDRCVRVVVKPGRGRGYPEDKKGLIKKAIEIAGGDGAVGVEVESELPIGSGLGSSAAVSAATIKAVREYLGKPVEKDELFKLTMECEKIAHGNPSGIDPATVVYGGLIAFRKGQPLERLGISKPLNLLLVDSGRPEESTKEMVELVVNSQNKEMIINKIGKLVEKIKDKLVAGEPAGNLINENGLLLEQLGVVGKRAKKLSSELRGLGYAVKITGAGGVATGSGMMIVFGKDFAQAKKLLDNGKINYFETVIGKK